MPAAVVDKICLRRKAVSVSDFRKRHLSHHNILVYEFSLACIHPLVDCRSERLAESPRKCADTHVSRSRKRSYIGVVPIVGDDKVLERDGMPARQRIEKAGKGIVVIQFLEINVQF